jgi:hypothetical protein
MAGYHSILATAVSALEPNTAAARRQLYERARSAMISEIEKATPPFDGADVAGARIDFESAVVRVEADAVQQHTAGDEAPPLSPDREVGAPREEGATAVAARETGFTDLLERATDGAGGCQSFVPRRARREDA